MNSNINLYTFVSSFGCHDEISDELILALVERSENKFEDILMLCPNAVNDNFTVEENIEYNRNFINKIDALFNMNLSEDAKNLCAIFLLKYVSDTEVEIKACESVVNVDINGEEWLSTIRDYIRYTLMGIYLRKGQNFERIKELTLLVKENHDSFVRNWKKMQNSVNELIRE